MDSDMHWLRTDVQVEALKGLRTCRRHLSDATEDAYELKWAALAITTSLQAFIIWTYRSIEVLAWDPKALAQFEEWEEGDRNGGVLSPTEPHLPSFLPLCQKLRDERGWEADAETWECLERLRDLRNDFMHFKPKGWSISADFLRAAIRAALDAVGYVVANEPGAFIWYDDDIKVAVQAELRAARALAEEPSDEQ